jgi:hypothetical protein
MKDLNRKLVTKAFSQEWAFRNATQNELLKFKKKLRARIKQSQQPLEEIKNKLLEKLNKDKEIIKALNDQLKNYPPSAEAALDPEKATYALKFNKMLEILEGAIEFTNTHFDQFIESVKSDQELAGYHIKTDKKEVTVMANDGPTIYGTSKGSIFKTVLLNSELIYSGKNQLSEIKADKNRLWDFISFLKKCVGIAQKKWIDETPNAQVTPLPGNLDPTTITVDQNNFTSCTYYYADKKTENGLAYTHSGYAFGAYRNDLRYPYPPGKQFGPEDCSSWVGKLTLGIDSISTADLWNRWKYQREGYSVSKGWENSSTAKALIARFAPIEITSPEDVAAGLVWATRSFDLNIDPDKKGDGKGGHTVLVTEESTDETNQVKGIGYNRDMPKIEGFGVSSFPIVATENKRIMFFKVISETREQKMEENLTEREQYRVS